MDNNTDGNEYGQADNLLGNDNDGRQNMGKKSLLVDNRPSKDYLNYRDNQITENDEDQ